MSIVGLLQYISPTIQLVIGVLVFREPFTRVQLTGFACVWAALALFAFDSLRASRAPAAAPRMAGRA